MSSTPGRHCGPLSPSATKANTSAAGRSIVTWCSADGMDPILLAYADHTAPPGPREGRCALCHALRESGDMTEQAPRSDGSESWPAGVTAALVVAVGLVVYLRTLLPGQAFGDWGEMQTVPHILGIAHPTGYPTYILLAWLAELAPLGSIAFRANLLSAIYVAAALATTTLIALRLGVRPLIAVAAGLALGATGTV